jgi:hypothetical protein
MDECGLTAILERHLAAVFGLSDGTAIRHATIAASSCKPPPNSPGQPDPANPGTRTRS